MDTKFALHRYQRTQQNFVLKLAVWKYAIRFLSHIWCHFSSFYFPRQSFKRYCGITSFHVMSTFACRYMFAERRISSYSMPCLEPSNVHLVAAFWKLVTLAWCCLPPGLQQKAVLTLKRALCSKDSKETLTSLLMEQKPSLQSPKKCAKVSKFTKCLKRNKSLCLAKPAHKLQTADGNLCSLGSSQCDHIAQKPYQSRLEEICSKLAVTLCKATLFCRISRGKHETETCPLGIRLITCRNGLETVIDNKYPSHPAHYFLSHAWQSITIAIAIASAITITCYYISFLHNTSHDIHHIPCLTYHYIPLHGIPLHTILLYNTIA